MTSSDQPLSTGADDDAPALTRRQRRELERACELERARDAERSRAREDAGEPSTADPDGAAAIAAAAPAAAPQEPVLPPSWLPSGASAVSPAPAAASPTSAEDSPMPAAAADSRAHDAARPTTASSRRTRAARPSVEPPAVTGAQRALGATLGRPRPRGRAAVVLMVVAALAIVLVPVVVSRFVGASAPQAGASGAASVISADAPVSQALDVAGKVGAVPVLSLHGALAPATDVVTDTLITGTGTKVEDGDAVLLSVATFSGTDGRNTTGTSTGTRLYRGTLSSSSLGVTLAEAVSGATEGSRIVLRAPVASDGVVSTEVTVVDVLPTTASGTGQRPDTTMPTATLNADRMMTVSVGKLAVPSAARASVLVQGTGRQVQADDVVVARYTSVSWSTGEVLSNTFGRTALPGTISMTNTMQGIAQLLVDVPVGSRVMLALPAGQADGQEAIAIVIDVLAVVESDQLTDATASASASPGEGVVKVTPGAGASATATPAG